MVSGQRSRVVGLPAWQLSGSRTSIAVPIEWYLDANGIPKRRWDAAALDYFWADTWMLMGDPGILLDQNGYPYFPNMEEQWADWMYPWEPGGDNSSVSISKTAIEEITDSYRCPPSPSNPDSGVLIRFPSTIPGADWNENGMFKIMRVTGHIERARFNFYITYEDLGNPAPGQTTCDVNRQDMLTTLLGQDLNPTDLNEDGTTDLMIF